MVLFDWDFEHNKVNEITGWDNQSTEVNPTYDAAGNLTDDKRDWKYTYDAWYRLVEVRDQSNNLKAQFRYNGLGFRVSMRYPSGGDADPWYHFAHDERWRIVAMFEGTDTDPTEQFWYQNSGASGMGSSSYIDEVVLRDRDTDGNGSLDERLYYLQNWHHDVVALCDTSGSVEERINYDAYGSPIGTFTTVGNRKGYAGYEHDPELSSTYHVRHRVLRSDLGIWTRRDPIGYTDSVNLYLYLANQPVVSTDPSGLTRHVFAFEGLGGHSGLSHNFVEDDWKNPVLAIPDTTWHYYAQDNVSQAVAEAEQIATTPFPLFDPNFLPSLQSVCEAYHTVIVLGFSNGGRAAIQFAEQMDKRNIIVNLGFTADPIPKGIEIISPLILFPSTFLTKPDCTSRWVNHYQRTDSLLKGNRVKGADVNIKYDDLGSDGHRRITNDQRVIDSLKTEVPTVPAFRWEYKCRTQHGLL